ncbi:hemerythrin domain-containing protein [Oricola sp.]|uniref:hemerythrin domain-containing protein n=1 Tax=Oricola sp. TaxID=1979950 RepID=UPI0025FDC3C4|nr:hemerythrin domain-containing protein [Oricola sp.]MCI5076359.1 hemerythrin domain-containing protein [Oricola sp.]
MMMIQQSLNEDNVIPLPGLAAGNIEAVCKRMLGHHEDQLVLCRKLEEVADELPELGDTQLCLSLARQIHPMIRDAHEYEEKTLFPLLMTIEKLDENLKSSLERLRYEHWEDESFADEVADALIRFVTDKASSNAETLAYMLRGFFEGLRRHIAFEREHIVPILCKYQARH